MTLHDQMPSPKHYRPTVTPSDQFTKTPNNAGLKKIIQNQSNPFYQNSGVPLRNP
jgi:hypothetical protein